MGIDYSKQRLPKRKHGWKEQVRSLLQHRSCLLSKTSQKQVEGSKQQKV